MLKTIQGLFNGPTLSAFRGVLIALGTLLGMFGVAALSPEKIDKIVAIASQVGVLIGSIAALAGVAVPVVMQVYNSLKESDHSKITDVAAIATDPTKTTSDSAKVALLGATASVVADTSSPVQSKEVKKALLDATAAMPEVVGTIEVTDKELAQNTQSEQIIETKGMTS